jgi:protein SCO1/2
MKTIPLLLATASLLFPRGAALGSSESLTASNLAAIRFDQNLGQRITPGLSFVDETGNAVQLGKYLGNTPVVLVLGYYECPMLCSLILNGFVESAGDMKWSIGKNYEVVNVSIDPNETPALAMAKKRAYVRRYGREGAEQSWHFLTGKSRAIQQLAREAGFNYAYDPSSRQYAHPSGLIILTPEGQISHYLFGVSFAPQDLYAALRDASNRRTGSPIQQLILLCFHYNPLTGKYSADIMSILRLMAAFSAIGMAVLIVSLAKRASRRTPSPTANDPAQKSRPVGAL